MIKKGGLALLAACLTMSIYSQQHYRVGAGLTGGLPTEYTNFSGGFDIFVEYLSDSPLSFRTGGGFAITKFNDENIYLNDLGFSLYWIEGSLMYHPVKSEYEPYLGAGAGYYFVTHEDFNEIKTEAGNYEPKEFNGKVSYHVKAGFAFPVHSSVKIHLQGKYLLFKQDLIIRAEESIDDRVVERTIEDEIDLSAFYITLGVLIKI